MIRRLSLYLACLVAAQAAFAQSTAPQRLSPQQSLQRLQFPPTCRIELVAAEPLTTDPVAIDFGTDGSLWVCEMRDYPSGLHGNFEPGGRIRVLRDDDGDGVYDRSAIFLDALPFPTGVTVWRKGVLVCAAPDILYAEDTDGDDRADIRRVLFSGFGTENYQARVNSLAYGLDGWVYGACGLFGGDIHSSITGKTVALGNRDFRIDPDRGLIEPLTGRTQQGRVRTDDGDWIGCNNSQPFLHYPLLTDESRPGLSVPPLIVNVPQSSQRLELFPRLADYQRFQLSGPAGRVTAACGLGIYRDDWLGLGLSGNAIICEPVNLLLHRRILKRTGVTFSAERAAGEEHTELLTSTDNWFRPVQVRTGPDGGLWIVDMSRAVIEHPRWIPEEARSKLDVRAGDDQGRILRLLPKDRGRRAVPYFSSMGSGELVAALRSPNGTVRDLAQQLIGWRDDRTIAPSLETLALSDALPAGRVAALWILARWQCLSSQTLKTAICSPDARIRRQAARMLVVHHTSFADAPILLDSLRAETDPLVILEIIEALRQIHAENRADWLARLFRDRLHDPYLRFAVLRAVQDEDWSAFVSAAVTDHRLPPNGLEPLLSVSLASTDQAALQTLLPRIFPPSIDALPGSWSMIEQVAVAWSRRSPMTASWLTPDQQQQLSGAIATARRLFAEEKTTDKTRTDSAGLLGLDTQHLAADADLLVTRLTPQSSPALQVRIIAALDRSRDSRVPDLLIARWASLGPAAKNDVLDRLLSRPASARALMKATEEQRFASAWLDAARRQALLQHADSEVRALAAKVLSGTLSSRAEVIAQHRGVLALTGDSQRGRDVYRKRCSVCHIWEGEGFAAGPDLGESRNKSWSAILTSLLDPNQAVDQRYAAYTVLTTDGRTLQGLLTAENERSVTLKGQEAKLVTIARSEIESLASSGRSLMPEGLERDLSPQDFADVCALLTQRTTSGETPLESFAEIARQVLDDSRPRAQREALIMQHGARSAELIAALTTGIASETKEEYRRIPWIWRVAVAAGKSNDAALIKPILDIALPIRDAPLADWQAVVIGGGIVNGLSQAGAWPHERIAEIIFNDAPLKTRWRQLLEQAAEMAHRDATATGTRYDALRIIALDGWARRSADLLRYLSADADPELQMGAVSGLIDIPDPPATAALIDALPRLKPKNRDLALDGLLRSEARMLALLDAVAERRVSVDQLDPSRQKRLLESPLPAVRQRAAALLPAAR